MNEMKPVFDYGKLKPEHQEAALEIISILEKSNNLMLAELIKEKFQIKVRPQFDIENTAFVEACKEAGLYCSIQGVIQEQGSDVDYQFISICDDIRKFLKLYDIIKNKQ